MKLRLIGLLALAGVAAAIVGCIPQGPRPTPGGPTPIETPVISGPSTRDHTAIFYVVHPEANLNEILTILEKNPKLKMTLIFPAKFFDAPERKDLLPRFRVLQSTGHIEVALTLDNTPILPLLGNLSMAFQGSNTWNFNFSWPDDIAGQIAHASGLHQKRWARIPSGLYPPYQSLSDQVVRSLQRFRLSYAIAKPQLEWGVRSMDPTLVLVPPVVPVSTRSEGSSEWAEELAKWTVSQSFSLIDSSAWINPESQTSFLNYLSKAVQQKPFPFETNRGEELQSYISETQLMTSKKDIYANDFSPWIRTSQQKAAWQAIAEARKVLEGYKNSGRAVLSRLDAASEEMYNAESGDFLFSLGQNEVPLPVNQRNFIATLANIYRLTNNPIPDNLNRLFSFSGKKTMPIMEKNGNPLEPFFESSNKSYMWNDPSGDDFGNGRFRYPYGNYPPGTFDLKKFSIHWTDDAVTFTVGINGPLPSEKIQPLLPMVDIYIDVNRISGAGSQEGLSQRGAMAVDRDAAWEYAVAMGQTTAVLYQSLPGKEPRKVGTFNPTANAGSKTFSVNIPLDSLRGRPSEWRMSVAMGGMEQSRQSDEPLPIPILKMPNLKSFGGAISGRSAPHFIDLLEPSADSQKERMQVYESGRKVVLPYVEAL